jgi:hypothetical protein
MVEAATAAKAGGRGAVIAVVTEATVGLDRAAQAAGDVLTGIFGGLPWEMSPGEIVDAVAGGGGSASEAPGVIVPYALDVAGVIV